VINVDQANDWYRSKQMADNVVLIWEALIKPQYRANIWLVRGRDRNALIDSGFGIVSLLDHFPELLTKPVIAIATHTHCDHIGSHHEFPQCEVHHAEAHILRNPTIHNTVAKGYVARSMFVGEPPAGFDPDSFSIRGVDPVRLLSDGDVIDLGDRVFQIIHIPGHSPGSIGLFEPATGILFSSDVVHNGENGIGRFLLYHSNLDDWLHSVERLRHLPVQTVHAGHFQSFGRKRYLEILDEYLERRRMPGFPLELHSYD
jgi:glyoxylase-like metal-dependent hydrolase (beta-lactamase superfamily II)